jgi:hypothetical protein
MRASEFLLYIKLVPCALFRSCKYENTGKSHTIETLHKAMCYVHSPSVNARVFINSCIELSLSFTVCQWLRHSFFKTENRVPGSPTDHLTGDKTDYYMYICYAMYHFWVTRGEIFWVVDCNDVCMD